MQAPTEGTAKIDDGSIELHGDQQKLRELLQQLHAEIGKSLESSQVSPECLQMMRNVLAQVKDPQLRQPDVEMIGSDRVEVRCGSWSNAKRFKLEGYVEDGFMIIPVERSLPDLFDGIFRYLGRVCHGHCAKKGLVDVTASSDDSGTALNVIHGWIGAGWECAYPWFCVQNEPNGWIQFDFKERKVRVRKYSTYTSYENTLGGCPTFGILEVSNDGEVWESIDERSFSFADEGGGWPSTPHLECNKPLPGFYRFVRFRSPEKTVVSKLWKSARENEFKFCIEKMELFGEIKEPL